MNIPVRWCIFILMLMVALSSSAQESAFFIGKVIDHESLPVPFATIRLVRSGTGVITNADGSFQIPRRESFATDTLLVTCIGFTGRRLPVSQLKPGVTFTIRLQPSSVELSGVVIQSKKAGRMSAKKIVAAAITQLSYNHATTPFAYLAYYRDYQIKDGGYINLNEAIVKVKDQGIDTDDQQTTRLQLIEYRPNTSFPIDTFARQPYDNRERKFIPHATLSNFAGNELATLMVHDPIRNHRVFSFSFINQFDRNFLSNHAFSMDGRINADGKHLYVIRFVAPQYISGVDHQSRGRIYIEQNNYRIHKLEYNTLERREKIWIPLYQVTVEYAAHDKKMYLNYISFNNSFRMRSPDDFRIMDIEQLKDTAAFRVRFSHEPATNALDILNYDLRLDGTRLQLDSVRFVQNVSGKPDYRMRAYLYLTDKVKFNKMVHQSLMRSLTLRTSNITDVAGRALDLMTFVDATQYREIFVQQLLKESSSGEYKPIDKFKPLYKMPVSPTTDAMNFWMNTPLKDVLQPVDDPH